MVKLKKVTFSQINQPNFLLDLGETCEDRYIAVGDFDFQKFMNSKIFQDIKKNKNNLIFSTLPIDPSIEKIKLPLLENVMSLETRSFHFPTNIVSPSIISLSSLKIHSYACTYCKCSLGEIITSVLSLGFRQMYLCDSLWIASAEQASVVLEHQIMSEISEALNVLNSGISIYFDGEMMDPTNTGTNSGALNLAYALNAHPLVKEFCIILPHLEYERLAQLQNGEISYVTKEDLQINSKCHNVLFRPNQSWRSSWLKDYWEQFDAHFQWWLDFISFDIPEYGGSQNGWLAIRAAAETSFRDFEGTFFLSESTKNKFDEFTSYNPTFSTILPCSLKLEFTHAKIKRNNQLIVLGNSFLHKGRVFAMELIKHLREINSDYRLILVGPNPSFANSEVLEEKILNNDPSLSQSITYLGKISDNEVKLFLESSSAVLCPSVVEGFGLVPFEAAIYGCVPFTSEIDFWSEKVSPLFWIDIDNLEKTAKDIDEVLQNAEKSHDQISAFTRVISEISFETQSNIAMHGFAITLARLKVSPPYYRETIKTKTSRKLGSIILIRKIHNKSKAWRNK